MSYGDCSVEGVILGIQLLRQTMQLSKIGIPNWHKIWTNDSLALGMNFKTLIRFLRWVEDELWVLQGVLGMRMGWLSELVSLIVRHPPAIHQNFLHCWKALFKYFIFVVGCPRTMEYWPRKVDVFVFFMLEGTLRVKITCPSYYGISCNCVSTNINIRHSANVNVALIITRSSI